MKTLCIHLAFLAGIAICSAQDYFAIIKKNDSITYNYPQETKFTLFDANGNATLIEKGDAVTVEGDYRIEAIVSWSDEPDVIESDGGILEIFVLENNWNDTYENTSHTTNYTYDTSKDYVKPQLESKSFTPSKKFKNTYNALFVFSNGMVFSYTDGVVRAYENGIERPVRGKYLVKGSDQTLKISYGPESKEMWYVFEKNKK